jgi:hypothetical protein
MPCRRRCFFAFARRSGTSASSTGPRAAPFTSGTRSGMSWGGRERAPVAVDRRNETYSVAPRSPRRRPDYAAPLVLAVVAGRGGGVGGRFLRRGRHDRHRTRSAAARGHDGDPASVRDNGA